MQGNRHLPESKPRSRSDDSPAYSCLEFVLVQKQELSLFMHVITRKRLNDFAAEHPETRTALTRWYGAVRRTDFSSFPELKLMFQAADQVGKLTVFNVGGNKVRIIAAIHYNRKRIYIRAVLTHEEYDRGRWKE